ncbi:hypothetical protein LOTGIDRAFT_210364 [Lottia gigantea]|uniref:EVA1 domain-containing protein n=1 Tax=Lottia gigantea TaxID=225164 RepID=V4A338_LOTGI|nr:hypothetical protein LOTGIDRAFT_210364 [Lottia gigantea]ESO89325.1 hypothetical protein LOTGIDRAFT_210364 [Lottia gigantea]
MNVTAKIDVGSSKEQNAWFVLLREMFNAWHYLKANEERVILYFVIAICLAIILMLTALLIKIGTDFKRSIRAKLDVTEPTHSHNYNSHNHTSMETPMLDGSDSLDRIEVVRFSPRGTLRNNDPGNRSLSNYYG